MGGGGYCYFKPGFLYLFFTKKNSALDHTPRPTCNFIILDIFYHATKYFLKIYHLKSFTLVTMLTHWCLFYKVGYYINWVKTSWIHISMISLLVIKKRKWPITLRRNRDLSFNRINYLEMFPLVQPSEILAKELSRKKLVILNNIYNILQL